MGNGRTEARIIIELAPDGFRDCVIHILTNQICEFEGSHAESHALYRGIYFRDARDTFFVEFDGLAVEGSRHLVDDKTRRVLGEHGDLTPSHHEFLHGIHEIYTALDARYNFDQRH